MKTVMYLIMFFVMCLPVHAEVWVVSKPAKSPWVATETHKPSKPLKVCPCSNQCICGCNDGKSCQCNQPKPQSPYKIVPQSEAMSCTVGNGH